MWCLLVAVLALLQTIPAEECIEYEDHEAEIHKCCSYVPPFPRDTFRECQNQAEEKADGDKHDFMACLFQCYFNTLEIVSGDEDTLNQDKIAEYLHQMSENARNILLAAYKECAAKTTGIVDVCNSYAMDIEMCAIQLFERQCPDEMFNPSEICDKVRAGVEFC
ncbi:uncharacterized protein LOC135707676 [Ochlerotatus camptorhynchus]|uniref:uncharacterized protein LOC135707676 n=1 Tax=Ochlerotatus camptorhynchus TaxID=644619 RepID=UPI0031D2A0F9